jgi:hypothetical protein
MSARASISVMPASVVSARRSEPTYPTSLANGSAIRLQSSRHQATNCAYRLG